MTIVTKSALIQRDIDILADMAKAELAIVTISVTTLDRDLARRMEPRAATPERRLEAIAALAEAGVPAGVLSAPMIPALNDSEMEAILERGARGRRAGRRLHAVAAAARIEGAVQGMARGACAEQGGARAVAGGAMPWRPALQLGLVEADDRRRPLCRDAGGRASTAPAASSAFSRARTQALDTTPFRPPPQKGDQLALF